MCAQALGEVTCDNICDTLSRVPVPQLSPSSPNGCQSSVDAPILQTGKRRLREAQTTELGWTVLMTRSMYVSKAKGPSLYSAPCILLLVIQLVDSGAASWMLGTQG